MAVIQAQIPERLRGRVELTFDLPASGNYPTCYAIWPTPTIGEFKDGRGEFYDTEPSGPGSRAILVRFLVTLDVTNNFPQLPIRTDGPYLVWLGILRDNQMLENEFAPVAERSLPSLSATGLLRVAPELVILDPTHRSRLRWLP